VQLMEVMTRGLPDEHGVLTPDCFSAAMDSLPSLQQAGALALGPGLGRDPRTARFACELASHALIPAVIDADGLNAHAGHLGDLVERELPTVLTPHAGELARLLETDGERIESERLAYARDAAERSRSVVVLKGDDTLIVEPTGRVAISRGNSPALATAGTGDVLTGAIAALLAQGLDAFTAAAAAVHLHAEAGREATRRHGAPEGVIASDVITALAAARSSGGGDRRARERAHTDDLAGSGHGSSRTRRS